MKIRILFKRCSRFNPISATTWLMSLNDKESWPFNYCHVELWVPGKNGKFEGAPTKNNYYGRCFSARSNGVSFKPAREVLKGFEWDYWEVNISQERYCLIMKFMQNETGAKYDYSGLMHFIIVFLKQKPSEWYCSEVVGTAVFIAGVVTLTKYIQYISNETFAEISPRDLGTELYKKYGKPILLPLVR